MEEGVDTVGVTGCFVVWRTRPFRKSWLEEGVDTNGNGVLLLFGGQDFCFVFEILGGGGCGYRWCDGVLLLFGGQDLFLKSWVEEGVDTVGNGVFLLFGGQDLCFVFEVLGGGEC